MNRQDGSLKYERLMNLELNSYNNSSQPALAIIQQDLSTQLFPDSQNSLYEVSITRFRIPISDMQLMLIDDNSEYYVQIEADVAHTTSSASISNIGTAYLQPTSINTIRSPADFIEYINRALARAHRQLISNFTSFIATTSASSQTFTTASPTKNVAISLSGATQTYYVKLTFSNYVLNSVTGSEQALVNIDLTSPAGTKVRVAAGFLFEAGKTYVFEDGGIKSYNQSKTGFTGPTLDTSYSITPLSTFLAFHDGTPNGNWVLSVSSCGVNTFSMNLNYSLEVCSPPLAANKFQFPEQPPVIDLDDNGYISWNLTERFLQQNFRIKLGDSIKSILNINKVALSNYVEFPVFTLSAALDQIKTIKQEAPKIYGIVQAEKIQISANGLNMDRDLNNDSVPSNAITTFLLPSDRVIDFTEIEYTTDSSIKPWRRYRLNNTSNLNRFTLSVEVVYKNGSRRSLYIEPDHSLNIMLSFFQIL